MDRGGPRERRLDQQAAMESSAVDAVTLALAAVNARLDRQECLLEKVLKVLGGDVASVERDVGDESAAQCGEESEGGGEVPFGADGGDESAAQSGARVVGR